MTNITIAENDKATQIIALHVVAPTEELWDDAKRAIDYPIHITMPCGEQFSAASQDDLPVDNVPCPCGNPWHWLYKISVWDLGVTDG